MHYYQHHIGDFIKDTSFLTNEEVGIYLKLLWLYYDTEEPLPNSMFDLSMKVNAREQQDALLGILNMFFILKDDKWHHTRCDKEISHYHQLIDTASKAGKASAAKRAMNKKSTGVQRAFESSTTDVQPTNNQEPITNNHIKTQRGTRLPTDWSLPDSWKMWAKAHRPDLNPIDVAASFYDYWISKPGAGGLKLNWEATWRNWVRSQKQSFGKPLDIVHQTTPTPANHDAALRKIEEDRKKAVPIPESVKLFAKQIKATT